MKWKSVKSRLTKAVCLSMTVLLAGSTAVPAAAEALGTETAIEEESDAETTEETADDETLTVEDSEETTANETETSTQEDADTLTDTDATTEEDAEETVEQGSISISIGSDETQRNFTWYSNEKDTGKILIAKEADLVDGEMPENAKSYTASVKTANNKEGYYSYQVTAKNLASDTTYAYQMVNGDNKTEIHTFTTGSEGAFSFAFAGDPQIGASRNSQSDSEGWEKTLNLINNSNELSGIDFMLSAGDQVNTANDESQYDYYLNHNALLDLPVATVVGNHDSFSAAYDEHFNVPNESSYGRTDASGDYYFVYNGVLFMALNSNNRSTAEHKAFMEEAIAATSNQTIKWKIVTFHHSIYSVANHAVESDILERREQLSPVFKDLDIDVVLMGHDHVYCRTYMMDGTTPMTDASIYDDDSYSSITNPEGILYVTANSASGSKYYTIQNNLDFSYSRVMNQERTPNISKVSISDDKFTITTYRTSDMSVVDTFTINHKTEENVITADDVTKTYRTTDRTFKLGATNTAGKAMTYSSDNKNVTVDENGKVTIKKKFMGSAVITIECEGGDGYAPSSREVTINVVPTKVKMKSVKNSAANKITVSWEKESFATGYELQYSTDKNFKKGVISKKGFKNSITKETFSGIAKGTKLYVRMRSYKTIDGEKYYSAWNTAKKVTVKK